MTYCSDCIHYEVCGNEGYDDEAMTYCADKMTKEENLWINNLWITYQAVGYPTFSGGGITEHKTRLRKDICVKDVIELMFRLVLNEMVRTHERETCWGDIELDGVKIAEFGATMKLRGASRYFNAPVKDVTFYAEWNCYTIKLTQKE